MRHRATRLEMSPRRRETRHTRCAAILVYLFGKRPDTIFLRHRIQKYPDSPSTCYRVRCGFIFSTLESGLKNIWVGCRIRWMRVDEAVSGKKKFRIQKHPDTRRRGLEVKFVFLTMRVKLLCKKGNLKFRHHTWITPQPSEIQARKFHAHDIVLP